MFSPNDINRPIWKSTNSKDANTSPATHLIPKARITKTSKLIYDAPKHSPIKIHSAHIVKQQSQTFQYKRHAESTRSRGLSSDKTSTVHNNADTNTISLAKSISSNANIQTFKDTMLKNKIEREKWSEKLQTYLTKSINNLPSQKSETNQKSAKVPPINLGSDDDDNADSKSEKQKNVNNDVGHNENLVENHRHSNDTIPQNNLEGNKINTEDEKTHALENIQYNPEENTSRASEKQIHLHSLQKSPFNYHNKNQLMKSNIKSIKGVIDVAPKDKSQSAISKISPAIINSNNICTKRGDKSFDSAQAREYMIQQQKKRKLVNKSTSIKSKIEQEEIKKRLQQLRKNSLRIVANNVNKQKRKKSIKSVDSEVFPCKLAANDTQTNTINVCEQSESVQKNAENCSIDEEKQQSEILPMSSCRRIGILRKFDDLPSIGSAKLSDKSPLIVDIEMGFQKLITSVEKENFEMVTQSTEKPAASLIKQCNDNTKPEPMDSVQTVFNSSTEDEHKLIVPDVTLKSDTLSESKQKSKQDCSTVKNTVNVPYWLKPTPVQAYPYNFITALRKKLEAVTKPSISDTYNKVSTFKTPLARPKYVQRKSSIQSFRDNLHKESADESDLSHESNSFLKLQTNSRSSCFEHVNKATNKSQNRNAINDMSKALRDATDNSESLNEPFDASIQKKTENNECDSQDTLSISSAIFSQSSPEKKNSKIEIGEPLSTKNINSMKIVSKSCNQSSDLISRKTTSHSKSMDKSNIIEMLEVFNKSLSQVISANQQLHEALSVDNNPVKMSAKETVDDYAYSSDFDSIADSAINPVRVESVSNTSVTEDIRSQAAQNEVDSVPIESNRSAAPTTISSSKSAYQNDESNPQILTDISRSGGAATSIFTELSDNITRYRGENYQSPDDEVTKRSSNIQSISSVSLRGLPQYKTSSSSVNHTNPSSTLIDSVYKEPISVADNENNPSEREVNNTTLGSDIYEFFNQPNTEYSVLTTNNTINQSVLSERNMSYSSIGMFEQLIQKETQKCDHLTAILKLREKSLLDRAKGQIAWLELQKQRYKEKGMTIEISVIKKKQRALLIRLEKERANIQKIIKAQKNTSNTTTTTTTTTKRLKLRQLSPLPVQRTFANKYDLDPNSSQATIQKPIRGIELVAGCDLEVILQRREQELQKRRHHVERLLQWHKRLDEEEQEVLQLERKLMLSTRHSDSMITERSNNNRDLKHIKEIEQSLGVLQNVSSSNDNLNGSKECVEVSGDKLNKLWRRLTGEDLDKFEPTKLFNLDKSDLAEIYEEAKDVVLKRFKNGILRSNSSSTIVNSSPTTSSSKCNVSNEYLSSSFVKIEEQRSIDDRDEEMDITNKDISLKVSSDAVVINATSSKTNNIENQGYFTNTMVKNEADKISEVFETEEASKLVPAKSLEKIESGIEVSQNYEPKDFAEDIDDVTSDKTEEIHSDEYEPHIAASTASTEIPELNLNFSPEPDVATDTVAENEEGYYFSEDIEEFESESREKLSSTVFEEQMKQKSSPILEASLEEPTLNGSIKEIVTDIESTLGSTNSDLNVGHTDPDDTGDDAVNTKSLFEEMLAAGERSSNTIKLPCQMIEDTSFPQFETTAPDEHLEEVISNSLIDSEYVCTETFEADSETVGREEGTSSRSSGTKSSELHRRLSDIDESLRDINYTIENAPVMELSSRSPSPRISESISVAVSDDEDKENASSNNMQKTELPKIRNKIINETIALGELITKCTSHTSMDDSVLLKKSPSMIRDYVNPSELKIQNKMPDIISEAEVLRRQQLQIEQEIKHLEQQPPPPPFTFVREIPNKPPPPYVPPAHGSPMTTIFPSNDRIKELVFRRMSELYYEQNNSTADKLNSNQIVDETITNIYERIILDICQECMNEVPIQHSSFAPNQAYFTKMKKYKHPLIFYNPPDRLECIQNSVLKRVQKLVTCGNPSGDSSNLNPAGVANGGLLLFQQISNDGSALMSGTNKRKRDFVDEILVQEMLQDEPKWTNFDEEKGEVLGNVTKEILTILIEDALKDCESAFVKKYNNVDRK